MTTQRYPGVEKNLYEILGISTTATIDDIKAAYRRLALEVHPDRNPSDPLAHAKFIRVQQAYEKLIDPARREAYDLEQSSDGLRTADWAASLHITFSMDYYGYTIPSDLIRQADQQADSFAAQAGISKAEAMSRILLDPLIAEALVSHQSNAADVTTLLKLADLYFHTYRSYEALEYYVKALHAAPVWETAARCEHIGAAYAHAQDPWGGVRMLMTFLEKFPTAPPAVRQQWADDGVKLLWKAEDLMVKDVPAERKYEIMRSFLAKAQVLGYRPKYYGWKKLAEAAVAAGNFSAAQEHLRAVDAQDLSPWEVSGMMRSQIKAGLIGEAVELGQHALPRDQLTLAMNEDERRICKTLAEAYELAGQFADAVVLYRLLSQLPTAPRTLSGLTKKMARLEKLITAHQPAVPEQV